MALLEDVLGMEGAAGPVAIGVGALLLAPRVLPIIGRVLRPVAKEVIKIGLAAYDEAHATVSEAYQATSDLVAEARSDREKESAAGRGPQTSRAMHKRSERVHEEPGGLAGQPG